MKCLTIAKTTVTFLLYSNDLATEKKFKSFFRIN